MYDGNLAELLVIYHVFLIRFEMREDENFDEMERKIYNYMLYGNIICYIVGRRMREWRNHWDFNGRCRRRKAWMRGSEYKKLAELKGKEGFMDDYEEILFEEMKLRNA